MNGFTHIEKLFIPEELIYRVHNHLYEMGLHGNEGIALWAGYIQDNLFYVTHAIIPKQTAFISGGGLCITVDADELHRINVLLYKNNISVIAQIHSHPGEAYHSSLDDTFPIAATVGSFSLVIPYFARETFNIKNCAIYRLNHQSLWKSINSDDVDRIIQIVSQ
jgi:hypothetical protein